MNDKNILMLRASTVAVLLVFVCLNACTTAHLNTIPSPAPSAKLRVLVLPITGDPPYAHTRYVGYWGTPHEEYKKKTLGAMSRFLQDKGIYEVVPEKDLTTVLGSQEIEGWKWLKNNMALVRQVGKALHADYAMITMRNFVGSFNYQFEMRCINLESGTQYTSSGFSGSSIAESHGMRWERQAEVTKQSYRQIFYDAKGDMLATAIRKGRLLPVKDIKKPPAKETKLSSTQPALSQKVPVSPLLGKDKGTPPPVKEPPQKPVPSISRPPEEVKVSTSQPPINPALEPLSVSQALPPSKPSAVEAKPALPKEPLPPKTLTDQPKVIAKISPPPPSDLSSGDKRRDFEKQLEKELQDEAPVTDKTRLVVYDFDASERLQVVSLILTEALREELFILGRFRLVNRENMMQVLQELKLQQSGLVDERQVVQLGKWLSANEAVTGRLAVLGTAYVLQAKRTDIKTLGTLGLGSLKCAEGQEDELLSGMPELARRLVGLKK